MTNNLRNGTGQKMQKIDLNDRIRDIGPAAARAELERMTLEAEQQADAEAAAALFQQGPDEPGAADVNVHTPMDLMQFNVKDDSNALFHNRWLCKSGSAFLIGSTGAGKSSLATQAAITWSQGEPLFGITPVRPLKSLIVQAENDPGDLAEMFRGVVSGTRCEARLSTIEPMIKFITETAQAGEHFIRWIRPLIDLHRPDICWIDPLFAFCGCGVSEQEKVSKFLRQGLGGIAQETGVCWLIVHHANKPTKDPRQRDSAIGSDYAYSGAGSAELANWARAVLTLRETEDGVFEFRAAKRGGRSGLVDSTGAKTSAIQLVHGTTGICWERAKPAANSPAHSQADLLKASILDALQTPPPNGWKLNAILSVIVDKKGGTKAGAKTWFYRELNSYLTIPIQGTYGIRVSKFQEFLNSVSK